MKNTYQSLSIILFIPFIVVGCSTGVSGENVFGREGSLFWFKTASTATQVSYFQDICRNYGFKEQTVEMAQCIQNESNSAKARALKRNSDYEMEETIKREVRRNSDKTITCNQVGKTMICN